MYSVGVSLKHFVVLLFFLISSCATLKRVEPLSEIVVVGVSSNKNLELANSAARARALDRAAQITSTQGTAFAFDRSHGKTILKLISQNVSAGVTPELEARKPVGARATIRVTRSASDLETLRALETVHVKAQASGLDLAVAQMRADRVLYRESIQHFARVRGKGDAKLYGLLRIVNYKVGDTGDTVDVEADIAVTFGTEAVMRQQSERAAVSEELEEVEPPEEQQ
jgi:hypothetical protein